jgi:hypothetical protein
MLLNCYKLLKREKRIRFLLFHFMFHFFLCSLFLYFELQKGEAATPSRSITNGGSAATRQQCSLNAGWTPMVRQTGAANLLQTVSCV